MKRTLLAIDKMEDMKGKDDMHDWFVGVIPEDWKERIDKKVKEKENDKS